MKYYLISFRAEYYCQGYEWGNFSQLAIGGSFEEACNKIKEHKTSKWEYRTPTDFKNETIYTSQDLALL